MGYTREDIIDMCNKAIVNVETFYKQRFINYRGKTEDSNELYNEIVAEYVCNHINCFCAIKCLSRKTSYCTEGHDGQYDASSNRREEITAMQIYNQCKDGSEYDLKLLIIKHL